MLTDFFLLICHFHSIKATSFANGCCHVNLFNKNQEEEEDEKVFGKDYIFSVGVCVSLLFSQMISACCDVEFYITFYE